MIPLSSDLIKLLNGVEVRTGTADPTIVPGITAPIGSLYLRASTPAQLYQKLGAADTAWAHLVPTSSFFGYGFDGDVVIAGTTTLARDMNYSTLTIQNGGVLETAGYRVFCRGALVVDAGGTIRNNGVTATTNIGGAGAPNAVLGRALVSGGNGGNAAGTSGTNTNLNPLKMPVGTGVGGAGGAGSGGAGGAGGTAPVSTALAGIPWWSHQLIQSTLPNSTAANEEIQGGSGGGGGGGNGAAPGGGGGGGGGVIAIAALTVTNNGVIQALGGNGAAGPNANTGGGGGGGGGKIWVITTSYSGTTPNVAGGTGGAGNGTGSAGTAGNAGFTLTMEP